MQGSARYVTTFLLAALFILANYVSESDGNGVKKKSENQIRDEKYGRFDQPWPKEYRNDVDSCEYDVSTMIPVPEHTSMYGGGVRAGVSVPKQYLYIALKDKDHVPLNDHSAKALQDDPDRKVTCTAFHPNGRRSWSQIFYVGEGRYLCTYMAQGAGDYTIEVRVGDEHVARSPLKVFKRNDLCPCPEPFNDFSSKYECRAYSEEPEIEHSLRFWPKGSITRAMFDQVVAHDPPQNHPKNRHSIHYVIKDNKLYARKIHERGITGVAGQVDPFLLSLLRKVTLPDMEFSMNMADPPSTVLRKTDLLPDESEQRTVPPPVISMSASTKFADIVFPQYNLLQTVMDRKHNVFQLTSADQDWNDKTDRVVWRGSATNHDRFKLSRIVNAKHKDSNNYDIGICNMVGIKHEEEKHGPLRRLLKFSDFFKYKYVMNVDGAVAAYRCPFLFLGGSAVFKQDSHYIEHFYSRLEPFKHFVPVAADFSDIDERVAWAHANQAKVKAIGAAGKKLLEDYVVKTESVYCYAAQLLTEYATRFSPDFVPTVTGDHELVENPPKGHPQFGGQDLDCQCRRT